MPPDATEEIPMFKKDGSKNTNVVTLYDFHMIKRWWCVRWVGPQQSITLQHSILQRDHRTNVPIYKLKGREWRCAGEKKTQRVKDTAKKLYPLSFLFITEIITPAQSAAFFLVFSNIVLSIYCMMKSVLTSVFQLLLNIPTPLDHMLTHYMQICLSLHQSVCVCLCECV